MTQSQKPFAAGDKVLRIESGSWVGPRRFHAATVAKVYKNGKFILEGDADRNQFRQNGSPVNSSYIRGQIHHATDELLVELRRERDDHEIRRKVNRLGDTFTMLRDLTLAREVWAQLPLAIRNMVKESN